jgi:hypothetical protein
MKANFWGFLKVAMFSTALLFAISAVGQQKLVNTFFFRSSTPVTATCEIPGYCIELDKAPAGVTPLFKENITCPAIAGANCTFDIRANTVLNVGQDPNVVCPGPCGGGGPVFGLIRFVGQATTRRPPSGCPRTETLSSRAAAYNPDRNRLRLLSSVPTPRTSKC